MRLCLLQNAHNPPVQRIHRRKMQPKSLRSSPRERNAGKGCRKGRGTTCLAARQQRCDAGREGSAAPQATPRPGHGSHRVRGPSAFPPRGTSPRPGRPRSPAPVPRPCHLPAGGARAGRGRPARRCLRVPRRVEIGVQRPLKHRGGWQGGAAAGQPRGPAGPGRTSMCQPLLAKKRRATAASLLVMAANSEHSTFLLLATCSASSSSSSCSCSRSRSAGGGLGAAPAASSMAAAEGGGRHRPPGLPFRGGWAAVSAAAAAWGSRWRA